MVRRCSFCGSWDVSAAGCAVCRGRGRPSGGLRRIAGLTLILVGAVLVAGSFAEVVQPFIYSRAATNPTAIAAFFGGAITIALGLSWK